MDEGKLDVSPGRLRELASVHRATAAQIRQWASEDGNFPAEYLTTHGLANYGTYELLVEYFVARRAAGLSLARANAETAYALASSADVFEDVDHSAGDLISGEGPSSNAAR